MAARSGFLFCGMMAVLLGVGGCCACRTERAGMTPLPAPITMREQVALLNARSQALPRLRATTVLRGVELRYPDKNGKEHVENVEGTLLLRQAGGPAISTMPSDAPQYTGQSFPASADVMLMGKAFDQQVFQAGRNAKAWWFIVRGEAKTATVGDATRPIDWERFGSSGPTAGILRADLVQDLLGLTALEGGMGFSDGDAVVMRVDDLGGMNDVLVESVQRGGRIWIKREILVDRRTGDIAEVRLYTPDGVMVVRSVLSDYRAAAYTGENNDAARVGGAVPRVAHEVRIEYPAQRMSVMLTFEKVSVPAKLNDVSFETPDFEGEGLKVERVE